MNSELDSESLVRHASFERGILQQIAKRSEISDPSLNFEQLLLVSERVSPSLFLGMGGVLFELYVLRLGKPRHVSFIETGLSNVGRVEIDFSTKRDSLIKDHALPFWFYVISSLPCVNQKCNLQLYRLSLNLEYRGLSRFGFQILSSCKVAVNPRTYDRKRAAHLVSYNNDNKKFILDNKVFLCFDNYNHYYNNPLVSLSKQSNLSLANFTVIGLTYLRTEVDNSHVKLPNGIIRTSVPKKLIALGAFIKSVRDLLHDTFNNFNDLVTSPYQYWEISRVVRERISCVPMKSEIKQPGDDPHPERGLSLYRPFMVSNQNTGSNKGLANVLTKILQLVAGLLATSYFYLRVDVDIYMKILRVNPFQKNS